MDIIDIFFIIAGSSLLVLGMSAKYFSYATMKLGQNEAMRNRKIKLICGSILIILALTKIALF